tara:strand:+ start:356 stop:661 length:306 start_codon:yes stop_codon:yes gene_type:complete
MLSLLSSSLSLNVGVKPNFNARMPAASMLGNDHKFGKLPASVSMAGACPAIVSSDGNVKMQTEGMTDGAYGTGEYTGFHSDFVNQYEPLSKALGCQMVVGK